MRGSDSNSNLEINATLQRELKSLLIQQQVQNRTLILEREWDFDKNRSGGAHINRSGSAPPTVEGALGAANSLFNHTDFAKIYETGNNSSATLKVLSEDEIRSHPAYLEYYYSHENLNPRLPPLTLSKEDWRVAQRIRAAFGLGVTVSDSSYNSGGGVGSSLFTMEPDLSVKKSEDDFMELRKTALRNLPRKNLVDLFEKKPDASSFGIGARRKSFADILQEGVANLQNQTSHVLLARAQLLMLRILWERKDWNLMNLRLVALRYQIHSHLYQVQGPIFLLMD